MGEAGLSVDRRSLRCALTSDVNSKTVQLRTVIAVPERTCLSPVGYLSPALVHQALLYNPKRQTILPPGSSSLTGLCPPPEWLR